MSMNKQVTRVAELLFKQKVNKSLLTDGLTLPVMVQDKMFQCLGAPLEKGQQCTIQIRIENDVYEASVTNVNLKEETSKRTVIQIRYSSHSPISERLNQEFPVTSHIVKNGDKSTKIPVPEDKQEWVYVYATGRKTLLFKCYTDKDKTISVPDAVTEIKEYIAARGFTYDDGVIENFYLSLKSKPFVILAGTSGTGKTRLVKLFAEAIDAWYQQISVRPDWSDSSDLLGHVDLNGHFVPGPLLAYIRAAIDDPDHPYILCLDEMNLAQVEYYLSDILSVMETREWTKDGHIVTDLLVNEFYYGGDQAAYEKYGDIYLPDNLYLVGTVNMDETTFAFSRKVLDRANTIEFSYVNLIPPERNHSSVPARLHLNNDFLKTNYLILNECPVEDTHVYDYCFTLQQINQILQKANAHVGYRVRDEIVFYLLQNDAAALLTKQQAMDYEIMQKILPRIQGSSASIKTMLGELFKICAGNYEEYQTQDSDMSAKMMKVVENGSCTYPRSAEKIAFMVRRLEEDGFTAYWL